MVVLPAACARLHDLNVGEDFLTARPVAEPLVLRALAAWAGRRRMAGGALVGLALPDHPLVALPVIGVAWCLEVLRDRRWLWGLALLPQFPLAAAAGIGPFARQLQRFDPAWRDVIVNSSGQVFLAT